MVKVIGNSPMPGALAVTAHAFSRGAAEAIQAAGGTANLIPAPNGSQSGDDAP
jgi:ribosomal protein L15